MKPQRALDLGASEGELSVRLADTFGTRVLAVEAKGVGTDHPLVEWRTGRIDSSQLADLAKVDVAFALSVLHHFPDWAAAWWALHRVADWVVAEVPHPQEGTSTKGSPILPWLADLVAASPQAELVCEYPGWKTSLMRPTYLVKAGQPAGIEATVKAGRGKTARQLPNVPGLADALGYEPFPGSLGMNLVAPFVPADGEVIEVPSRYGNYLFTPARLSGITCHVMRPPRAKNRPGTAEVVAPVNLRTVLALADGATVWLGSR